MRQIRMRKINQIYKNEVENICRCGFLAGDSKEISPIFTQFIDTTWQLMNQFPQAFQFNHK